MELISEEGKPVNKIISRNYICNNLDLIDNK